MSFPYSVEELARMRYWMYNQRNPGESYNTEAFMNGVANFLETVANNGHVSSDGRIRCPCSKCKNKYFRVLELCETHLYRYGFVNDYHNWTLHGEPLAEITFTDDGSSSGINHTEHFHEAEPSFVDMSGINSRFPEMLRDVAGPSNFSRQEHATPEISQEAASHIYDIFKSSLEPAYKGCTTETELSISMKLIQAKTDHGLSEAAFDSICAIIGNLLGCENRVPTTFREAKKLVSLVGLGYTRIDVCTGGCMIYYGDDESLSNCRICGESRYNTTRKSVRAGSYKPKAKSQMFYLPIIPRLQRLYANEFTAKHMIWHASRDHDAGNMVHPSDGESWKHFDRLYPSFSSESRNIRLGLCSDGFSPFNMSAKSYSIWPVMLTPYNLPPWMCMKSRYLWLTLLIPGPKNPKKRIDIYMRPLIDDLLHLWNSGVETFDAYTKQNFNLRAVLLWTISDFPAYGMLSGWSTQGRLGCPYCMEHTNTFVLKHGRKVSYFDCHRRFLPANHSYRRNNTSFFKDRVEYGDLTTIRCGHLVFQRVSNLKTVFEQDLNEKLPGFGTYHNWTKKSIFWELPYWVDMKLRHHLDVMHTEKNVFENLFKTITDVKGKSKDNGPKCRNDIALYCNRPEMELRAAHGKVVVAKAINRNYFSQMMEVPMESITHNIFWKKRSPNWRIPI